MHAIPLELVGLCALIFLLGVVIGYWLDRPKTKFDRWAEEIEKDAIDQGKMEL